MIGPIIILILLIATKFKLDKVNIKMISENCFRIKQKKYGESIGKTYHQYG